MKKFFITCLYLSLTVAVCTAGFLLPSKNEHTAIEPPELTYSSSLFDTLRLLSKDHYFVEYPSAGSSRTGEEIYAAACGLLKQLTEYGVLSPDSAYDITTYTTALQLAIVSHSTQKKTILVNLPQTLLPRLSGPAASILIPVIGSISGLTIRAAKQSPVPCLPNRHRY